MGSLSDRPTRGEKRKITNFGYFLREWLNGNAGDFPRRDPGTGSRERNHVEVLLQNTPEFNGSPTCVFKQTFSTEPA